MNVIVNVDPAISPLLSDSTKFAPKIVKVSGDVTEEAAVKFRTELAEAEAFAEAKSIPFIPVVINSYGGSVYAAFDMVAAMRECSSSVITVAVGKVMSAGALLFSCGERRYMSPLATAMLHEVSAASWGKLSQLENRVEEYKRMNEIMFNILDENCGQPAGYFAKLLADHQNLDLFMDSEACLEHNLATDLKVPRYKVDVLTSYVLE